MSVLVRQGLKYSIIGYFGFLLGTFANFFIFPYDLEFYGKLRFIFPMAEMLVPIVVFGTSFSNVKFFPQAQKEGRHQNMLSLSILGIILNFIIFCCFYFLSSALLPQLKSMENWSIKQFILPLVLILSISTVLNKYISNYKRIAIPNIFENLFPKLANIGAFCAFFFLKIPENWTFLLFISFFLISMLGYFWYNNKLEKFSFNFSFNYFKKDKLWQQILVYSFFGFLGNMGSFLALKISNIIISEYISFEQNGLYSTIFSIITLINIPQMGLHNISAPVINKHLSENTLQELDKFHKNTSLALFFLGLSLFSCIVLGFPFLTELMKNGHLLLQAEPILWIVGFAMLFDLATGFNSHIISLSKFYKYNTLFMLILACLNIGTNILFLKYTQLGILGVAISYAISLTIFNLLKIIFNYYHFKVFPLSWKILWISILCGTSLIFVSNLPLFEINILNLLYKPLLVLILIIIGNQIFNIYPLKNIFNKNIFRD